MFGFSCYCYLFSFFKREMVILSCMFKYLQSLIADAPFLTWMWRWFNWKILGSDDTAVLGWYKDWIGSQSWTGLAKLWWYSWFQPFRSFSALEELPQVLAQLLHGALAQVQSLLVCISLAIEHWHEEGRWFSKLLHWQFPYVTPHSERPFSSACRLVNGSL